MFQHGSVCLEGPVTKSRAWWAPDEEVTTSTRAIRHELVARVRAEIAAGEYDTPEKMEQAMARLIARLENE